MVTLKLLRPVKDADGWNPEGTIRDYDSETALFLTMRGYAAVVEESAELPPDDNDGNGEGAPASFLVTDIDGVTESIADQLIALGIDSVELVAAMTIVDLVALDGVGDKTAQRISTSAQEMVESK